MAEGSSEIRDQSSETKRGRLLSFSELASLISELGLPFYDLELVALRTVHERHPSLALLAVRSVGELVTVLPDVRAEGVEVCVAGSNKPLHLHPVFQEADLFHMGKPTMIAFGQRDVRQGPGSLPVAESMDDICFRVPWFKYDRPEIIREYADAFRKIAENAEHLQP